MSQRSVKSFVVPFGTIRPESMVNQLTPPPTGFTILPPVLMAVPPSKSWQDVNTVGDIFTVTKDSGNAAIRISSADLVASRTRMATVMSVWLASNASLVPSIEIESVDSTDGIGCGVCAQTTVQLKTIATTASQLIIVLILFCVCSNRPNVASLKGFLQLSVDPKWDRNCCSVKNSTLFFCFVKFFKSRWFLIGNFVL